MKISHTAIDHPRLVIVGTLLMLLLSIFAAWYIPIQLTPAIHTAVILVAVPFPGAQPVEVEEQITHKIEDALQRLEGVDFIASTSMRGSSITQVIFLDGIDSKQARNDVAHLIGEIKRELPLGRDVEPMIREIDFDSLPLMLVNISGPEGYDERSLKQVAKDVQDELEAIHGVANTQLFGGREREIHVSIHPGLLVQYGLSIESIRRALGGAHSPMPAGSLNSSEFDLQVRNESKFRGVNDIREVVVGEQNGRLVQLKDVAEVEDAYSRLQNIAQLDGRNAATIIVYKEPDINTLGTAEAIKSRVTELQSQYPHLWFSCTRDMSADIGLMFSVLGSNAICGAVLVFLILAWSMGFRSSLLVITAIPFSTAAALLFLYVTGTAISNMVLFSFILVLGMVVDGAIIVTENIHRHIERGLPPVEAAKLGIDEVSIPVFAADLTAIAAFLPMLLVPGIMGDFLGVMPVVVSVSLVGSLITDHFLVPVLAAWWYKRQAAPTTAASEPTTIAELAAGQPETRIRRNLGPFSRTYLRLLKGSIRYPLISLALCGLAVIGAMGMLALGAIKFDFFPKSDRGQFEIAFELPLGYSIEETMRAAKVITEPLSELQKTGEVVHFVTAIGSSQGLSTRLEGDPVMGPEFGKVMVQLLPATERRRSQTDIIAEVRSKIRPWPDMTYRIEEVSDGPPGGADVAIRLSGKDLDQLGDLGAKLAAELRKVRGTIDVSMDYRPDSPELVIEPRPEVVGLFGFTEAEVARAVQTAIHGDDSIELNLNDEDVPLRLQALPQFQRHQDDVRRLMLRNAAGRMATVEEVAEVRREQGLYSVNRWNLRRAVKVTSNVDGVVPDEVFLPLKQKILPDFGFAPVQGNHMAFLGKPNTPAEGVRAEFTGENEERDEGFTYLTRSMIVAVVLIFAILVVQFNSFRQATVVMMTVPLSFIGVVFGMWICNFPFSLASFIGLVALTGIVVNDAIVLVDFTNQARGRGLSVYDALIEAGINRSRPVMLTLATTIGDMIPLFLNLGGGAEFWQPLTGAIIFGISFATLLTLIVIPVGYSLAYGARPSAG